MKNAGWLVKSHCMIKWTGLVAEATELIFSIKIRDGGSLDAGNQ